MFENDTNATDAVSRRNVLKTAGGLLAGGTAIVASSGRGAATPDRHGSMRATLRERTEESIAVEVWFPRETYDELKPLNDVYLGDADQFVVHDDEDAVSLPEEPDRLANPVEMEDLGIDGEMHGKLMSFLTGDVDWPNGHEGVDVTLAVGAFPERTVTGSDMWDTCPGLWLDVRETTEDYIEVEASIPDDRVMDDVEFQQDVFLGRTEWFVIHEEENAVSLPDDTDRFAKPVEVDLENEPHPHGPWRRRRRRSSRVEVDLENEPHPHSVTMYFRTGDLDLSEVDDEEVTLGLGLFPERTVSGDHWDTDAVAVDATCPDC